MCVGMFNLQTYLATIPDDAQDTRHLRAPEKLNVAARAARNSIVCFGDSFMSLSESIDVEDNDPWVATSTEFLCSAVKAKHVQIGDPKELFPWNVLFDVIMKSMETQLIWPWLLTTSRCAQVHKLANDSWRPSINHFLSAVTGAARGNPWTGSFFKSIASEESRIEAAQPTNTRSLDRIDLIRKLLSLEADPNARVERYMRSPRTSLGCYIPIRSHWQYYLSWLDWTVSNRYYPEFKRVHAKALEVAKIFIDHGADTNAKVPFMINVEGDDVRTSSGKRGIIRTLRVCLERSCRTILDRFCERISSHQHLQNQHCARNALEHCRIAEIRPVYGGEFNGDLTFNLVLKFLAEDQQQELIGLALRLMDIPDDGSDVYLDHKESFARAVQRVWTSNQRHVIELDRKISMDEEVGDLELASEQLTKTRFSK